MSRAYIKYEDLQKTTITCFFQIFPRLLRQGSNGRRIVYDASALGSSAAAALPKKARENLKKTSICSFLKIFVSYVCSPFFKIFVWNKYFGYFREKFGFVFLQRWFIQNKSFKVIIVKFVTKSLWHCFICRQIGKKSYGKII